jgi:hypothetical protein
MHRRAFVLVIFVAVRSASAQELTPGAYTPAPIHVNFVGVQNQFNRGDVTFEPSLPVTDARATINTTVAQWGRTMNLGGRYGNIVVAVPFVAGHLEGLYLGEFQQIDRAGFADPQVRAAINLYGAPALPLKEFVRQRRRAVVGASLSMTAPLGNYDSARAINIGTHRWAFKPEVGVSRTVARWTFEGYAGVWLFTANDAFRGTGVRTQEPLFTTQFHVEYAFRPRLWLAFNSNFYSGGRTTLNGTVNLDFQKNSRVGGTLSVPAGLRNAFKFAVSRGAYTTIGADFTSLSVGYQYTWGGGM